MACLLLALFPLQCDRCYVMFTLTALVGMTGVTVLKKVSVLVLAVVWTDRVSVLEASGFAVMT